MNRTLQAPWMIPVVGSIAFLATTVALLSPANLAGVRHNRPAEGSDSTCLGPSWDFRNPEMEKLVAELRQEKEALKQREQDLKALETRLQSERHELIVVTQSIARLQKEFDQNVLRLKDEEAPNYRKLAKLHASMSPEGAAAIFREMPDDEVAKIFAYMKVEDVSQVLDTLGRLGKTEAKRVVLLTDKMRRTLPPAPTAPKSSP
jgi:hypothetical protein